MDAVPARWELRRSAREGAPPDEQVGGNCSAPTDLYRTAHTRCGSSNSRAHQATGTYYRPHLPITLGQFVLPPPHHAPKLAPQLTHPGVSGGMHLAGLLPCRTQKICPPDPPPSPPHAAQLKHPGASGDMHLPGVLASVLQSVSYR